MALIPPDLDHHHQDDCHWNKTLVMQYIDNCLMIDSLRIKLIKFTRLTTRHADNEFHYFLQQQQTNNRYE